MTTKIFDSKWEALDLESKKKHLAQGLLGLQPVIAYLDDEEDALEIFEHRCHELGIEARTSSDPKELLDFVSKNKSRLLLVVSDYKMPQRSGFDFRAHVLEVAEDVPFIILSGHVDRELALEGVKHKINAFIEKPLKRNHLVDFLLDEGEKRAQSIKDDYEMIKGFTDDVSNIIEEVEDSCLQLENDPQDHETIARVFGLIHTVKGSSGFFEPRTLHLFAHAFEDQLKQIQNGSYTLNSEIISVWLKALDVIRTLNKEFMTGNHQDHDVENLKSMFTEFGKEKPSEITQGTKESKSTSEEKQQRPNDLKVSMQILDEFTQTSGELTVIRNMINKVVRSIEKQHRGDKDVVALSELLDEMHKINSDVQNKIADIRRVGISNLVKPLARNLRDTSKALGKEVDFVVEGQEVRLDNSIAELLSRCLVHLMRNSLDHGIESAEDRLKSDKPAKGKLLLKFESRNESIFVTIKDDGRGINADKIRQKVISQGMRTEAEANLMSATELHYMIFEAGFSTAQEITEFSGRGVGMSMVKDTIESANGKITIKSEAGKGSEFILEIPVPKSVLITSCLFVSAGEMIFGIPQENIVKVIEEEIQTDLEIEHLEGGEFLRFENGLIPIVSLNSILKTREGDRQFLVILESDHKIFALRLDSVFDIEDAVIKQLGPHCLKSLSIYQGGTFLGDGTVGLIFDVPGLVQHLELKNNRKESTESASKEDDSVLFENLMVFELELKGLYALRESDIFRVEFIERAFLQISSDLTLMPYRESILTMIDTQDVLFSQKLQDKRESIPTLIIRQEKGYLGLEVKNIIDLVKAEIKMTPHLKKVQGLSGNILFQGKTYTLLSLDELRHKIEGQDENSNPVLEFKLAA